MNRDIKPVYVTTHRQSSNANWRTFAALFVAMLIIQSMSALWWVEKFGSPNKAVEIARSLEQTGNMFCQAGARLYGPQCTDAQRELKYFHSPGHPLLLAFFFKLLPASLERFIHVPIAAGFIVAVALVLQAWTRDLRIALLASLIVGLNPFYIIHGPVFDDTFLGATQEWLLLVMIVWLARKQPATSSPAGPSNRHVATIVVLSLMLAWSAWMAVTRSSSVAVFGLIALAVHLFASLRPFRMPMRLVVLGMMIGLGCWGVRNKLIVGQFALGTSHDGITLWESNYPQAAFSLMQKGQVERMNDQFMAADFAATASLDEYQADKYFKERAKKHILENPLGIAEASIYKMLVNATGLRPELALLHPRNLVSLACNLSLAGLIMLSMLFRFSKKSLAGTNVPTQACANSADAFASANRSFLNLSMLVMIFVSVGLMVIGPAGLRYRIGIEPIIALPAAYGAMHLLRRMLWILSMARQQFTPNQV